MKLNVLIIEDDALEAHYLKKIILSNNHNVVKVSKNSEDALKTAKNIHIDLVISDINIDGDIDGVECSAILQDMYGVCVIFTTACNDMITLEKIAKVDYTGYVIKPFRRDEIEANINLAILKHNLLEKKNIINISDEYAYSYEKKELYFKNTLVELRKQESKFLELLVKSKGAILSHRVIDYAIWDGKFVEDVTRRQLIHKFKKNVPNFPFRLVKGEGYVLERHNNSKLT